MHGCGGIRERRSASDSYWQHLLLLAANGVYQSMFVVCWLGQCLCSPDFPPVRRNCFWCRQLVGRSVGGFRSSLTVCGGCGFRGRQQDLDRTGPQRQMEPDTNRARRSRWRLGASRANVQLCNVHTNTPSVPHDLIATSDVERKVAKIKRVQLLNDARDCATSIKAVFELVIS